MAMIVQHNLTAINSNRMLGVTTSAQAKSSEKLSSGYRINRAADDAAGLTISEKMRKQIRGLDRASTNAQDGVSAVQTAEGALTEVHSMLQRMNELATQAANGTNSEADREAIQAEIDQLSTEIDRVAETTKFNEIYLLKGDAGTKTINMEAHDAGLKGTLTDNGDGTATFVMDELSVGDKVSIGGQTYNIINDGVQTEAAADEDYTYTTQNATATIDLTGWTNSNTSAVKVGGATVTGSATVDSVAKVAEELNKDATFSADYTASNDGDKLIITAKDAAKAGADVAAAFDFNAGATKVNNTNKAAGDVTSEDAAEPSFKRAEGVKLYAENGTKELTDEEAIAELEKGNKLYTTEGVEFKQTTAKVTAKGGSNATATIDLTGWTNSNTSAVKVGGATVTGSTTVDSVAKVVEELNKDATFSADYTASNDGDKLIITAKDAAKAGADVAAAFDFNAGATKVNNTNKAAGDVTSEDAVKPSDYETNAKALYAKGGTEALSDEEIMAALEKGETLYSTAAMKGDNDITAKEAYELAKAELLKANQIGDTKNSAKVSFAAEAVEKKAEDYKAGDTFTIDGKEYTVGTAKEDVDALLDAIETAEKAGTDTGTIKISYTDAAGKEQEYTITPNGTANTAAQIQQTKTDGAASTTTKTYANIKEALAGSAGAEITITTTNAAITAADIDLTPFKVADDTEGNTVVSAAKAAELENAAAAEGDDNAEPTNSFNITTGSTDVSKTLSFNLHVGADADMTNKIQVNIETMNSAYLGIKGLNVTDTSGIAGTYAIDAIQDAISKVSAQRSALGAVQNRLEHTITNLDNVVENTTSAESRIRDLDMAKEMVEYSKNNILAQAGQSMLAQANQSTQGVLSLLG